MQGSTVHPYAILSVRRYEAVIIALLPAFGRQAGGLARLSLLCPRRVPQTRATGGDPRGRGRCAGQVGREGGGHGREPVSGGGGGAKTIIVMIVVTILTRSFRVLPWQASGRRSCCPCAGS